MSDFDLECPRCHGKGVAAPVASPSQADANQASAPISAPPKRASWEKALFGCVFGAFGFVVLLVLGFMIFGSNAKAPVATPATMVSDAPPGFIRIKDAAGGLPEGSTFYSQSGTKA